MHFSTEHFARVRDLIYKKLGLYFEDNKHSFIKRRIESRMQTLGLKDPKDYIFMLAQADTDGSEMQQLANLVTTNETYMFREHEQLEGFANYCLPDVLEAKLARGDNRLNIWSAGCSSGEEAYTLAIIVRELVPQCDKWRINILATDIDENILNKARAARYSERSVKLVPVDYQRRHLIKLGNEYGIHPDTASLVVCRHLNLSDHNAMAAMRGFDFIFCRNVLIYFDDASRKATVEHFYDALNPGGFVFLGHSESVGRITNVFTLRRVAEHLIYCKTDPRSVKRSQNAA